MNVVTKYRKRPLFRLLTLCTLALLAGLALAPGFGASAKKTEPLLADGKNTGDSAIDIRPAARPKVIPQHFDRTSTPSSESQGEQAPAAQPEQNGEPTGFDEDTTFAIGEPAEQHGYGYHNAAGFAALGTPALGGSGGRSGGQTKSKHLPQIAAGNPTQNPHGSADDTTPGDTAATGPSDQPEGNPHDDTNPNGLPVASVPEPSSIALLAIGLLGLTLARRYS